MALKLHQAMVFILFFCLFGCSSRISPVRDSQEKDIQSFPCIADFYRDIDVLEQTFSRLSSANPALSQEEQWKPIAQSYGLFQ